jgi:hypothetical protein
MFKIISPAIDLIEFKFVPAISIMTFIGRDEEVLTD